MDQASQDDLERPMKPGDLFLLKPGLFAVVAVFLLIGVIGVWRGCERLTKADRLCSPNQVVTSFYDDDGKVHAVCKADDKGTLVVR